MTRLVVVGGGIAGLAAGFEAMRSSVDVTVLEADDRPGGKIRTAPFAGLDVDTGPDAFLARVPYAIDLCRELGLETELVSPSATSARLFVRGELRPIPQPMVLGVPLDPGSLAASGVVSDAGIDGLRADLARTEPAPDAADSIGQLIRTRMGDEILENLVGPLLGGINAGDADRLSLSGSAAQLASAAAADPSLGRALIDQRARAALAPNAPVFHSLPGGLGRLIDALAAALERRVRCSSPVARVEPGEKTGWVVVTADGVELPCEGVVLAVPASVADRLLQPLVGPTGLATIDYAGVALVTLALPLDRVRTLDASGFLVPRAEGRLITAAQWLSSKWAHLAPEGQALIRASAGRFGDDRAVAMDDDDLVAAVRADLAETMGLAAEPTEVRVTRWPESFPQYTPGHPERIDTIEALVREQAPGIELAGAAYRGIGIPACIDQGRRAAQRLIHPSPT